MTKLRLDGEFRDEVSKFWKIEKIKLDQIVPSPEVMSKNGTVSTGKMFGVLLMFEHWKGLSQKISHNVYKCITIIKNVNRNLSLTRFKSTKVDE